MYIEDKVHIININTKDLFISVEMIKTKEMNPMTYNEGKGQVEKTKKNNDIPKDIPIREIITEEQFRRFKELYKQHFGELDFCTTCASAINWAANRLNQKYGYK